MAGVVSVMVTFFELWSELFPFVLGATFLVTYFDFIIYLQLDDNDNNNNDGARGGGGLLYGQGPLFGGARSWSATFPLSWLLLSC